jgi:ADP-ribose pyrophosphatase YjhB (NUDIX family)/GNAT superfamily N-acetyltransferase
MKIEVRSATPQYSAQIKAIDTVVAINPSRPSMIDEWLTHDVIKVAIADGRIVGYGVFNHDFFHQSQLDMLMVAEDVRGLRIGERLLQEIERIADTPKFFVTTNQSNSPMQRLLVRNGYSECGRIEELDPGDPELVYFKWIAVSRRSGEVKPTAGVGTGVLHVPDRRYTHGYSLGVGGVVVNSGRVLLVRSAEGPTKGQWVIPGGYVEHGETLEAAVVREISEEAGIHTEIDCLVAVRNRVVKQENSMYVVFQLHSADGKATPDGVEVSEARFFTIAEIQSLSGVRTLSRMVSTHVLEGKAKEMKHHQHPEFDRSEFVLYM